MNHESLVWLFDRFLLVYIAAVILMVGLLLGWDTALGRAMARYKVVLAAVFVGALLSSWWPFFVSEHWRWPLRVGLVITLSWVVWQFQRRFGGWRAMHAQAWANLQRLPELVRWHREDR